MNRTKKLICLAVCLFVIIAGATTSGAQSKLKQLKKKMTHIASQGFGNAGQNLPGYWWMEREQGARETGPASRRLVQISVLQENRWLLVHSGHKPKIFQELRPYQRNMQTDNFSGVFAQYKFDGECFKGLTATEERPKSDGSRDCPQYFWWSFSQLCLSKQIKYSTGRSVTKGYEINEKDCTLNRNSPLEMKTKWERFVGVSFIPVLGDKYIYIGAAAAPAQYKVSVQFAWDYTEIAAKNNNRSKIVIKLGPHTAGRQYQLIETAQTASTYQFVGANAGLHHFVFEVFNSTGKMIHRDQMVAELPRVPGIN